MTRRHTIQQPHSKPPAEPPKPPRRNNSVYENVVLRPRPGANNESIKRSRPIVASQPQPQQQQTSLLLPGPPSRPAATKSETPAASSAKNEAIVEDLMSFNPAPKIKNDLFSDLDLGALYKPQPLPNLPALPSGANFPVTQQPQRGFITSKCNIFLLLSHLKFSYFFT